MGVGEVSGREQEGRGEEPGVGNALEVPWAPAWNERAEARWGKEKEGRQRWRIFPGHAEVIFFFFSSSSFKQISQQSGYSRDKDPEKPTTQRRRMGASSPQPDSTCSHGPPSQAGGAPQPEESFLLGSGKPPTLPPESTLWDWELGWESRFSHHLPTLKKGDRPWWTLLTCVCPTCPLPVFGSSPQGTGFWKEPELR